MRNASPFSAATVLALALTTSLHAKARAQLPAPATQHAVQNQDAPKPEKAGDPANPYAVPTLLTENFYKLEDVCADAKKRSPEKKLALVLVKTDYCDIGSGVCIKGLRTLSDPANLFVRKNFATYHTSFINYELKEGQLNIRCAEGTTAIRKEWVKPDADPEYVVVDLSRCKVLGRNYLYADGDNYDANFNNRYQAGRKTLLGIPGVADALGLKDPVAPPDELNEVGVLRQKYAEQSLVDVYKNQVKQSLDLKVRYNDMHQVPATREEIIERIGRRASPDGTPYTKCMACEQRQSPSGSGEIDPMFKEIERGN